MNLIYKTCSFSSFHLLFHGQRLPYILLLILSFDSIVDSLTLQSRSRAIDSYTVANNFTSSTSTNPYNIYEHGNNGDLTFSSIHTQPSSSSFNRPVLRSQPMIPEIDHNGNPVGCRLKPGETLCESTESYPSYVDSIYIHVIITCVLMATKVKRMRHSVSRH